MSEIERIQLRILDLEREQNIKDSKSSIEYDFNIINELLDGKKNKIKADRYSGVPLEKLHDKQLVTYLEAIYNILQNLDHRLSKLEEKN
jgi:hypothetical protein